MKNNTNFENLNKFFLEFLSEFGLTPETTRAVLLDTTGMIYLSKECVEIDISKLATQTGKTFNEVDTIFDKVYKKHNALLYRRSGATCSYVSWRQKK